MKRLLLAGLVWLAGITCFAGTVDSVDIYSPAMKKSHRCVVIKPSNYKKKKKEQFPVVYLLHGYSGNYANWIMKVPELSTWADVHQMLIVCPDGNFSSWYYDSPIDSNWKYETYITAEVVPYIDAHYRTLPDPAHRAITGLSMGGHGGLFLGLRHPNLFGACGSMSGGVDVNTSRQSYDIAKRIGDTAVHTKNWQQYSVYFMIDSFKATTQNIIIDCGTDDFFYQANKLLHEKMLKLQIPHDYTERPGKHDWLYWQNAVGYQLLYFDKFFRTGR